MSVMDRFAQLTDRRLAEKAFARRMIAALEGARTVDHPDLFVAEELDIPLEAAQALLGRVSGTEALRIAQPR